MCGICGVWEYGASRGNITPGLLASMRDVMTHRGPDDAGELIFDEGRGGFGFRRLSIIDLSEAGHQPMRGCTDRVVLVFNGEIYNHAALRAGREQRGHVYASRTDSETILHLYEERGLDFVHDIEGDYAIAIWDADRERLVLARDLLTIDRRDELRITQYWDALPAALPVAELSESEHEANILKLLRDSIKK